MIDAIIGQIQHDAETHNTVLVTTQGGIIYRVITSSHLCKTYATPQTGQILTYYHIRDTAHTLYGFSTHSERHTFYALLKIPGFGPSLAMNALDKGGYYLTQALSTRSESSLKQLPKIGQKAVDSLLNHKQLHKHLNTLYPDTHTQIIQDNPPLNQDLQDLITSLSMLGTQPALAQKAAQAVKEDPKEEQFEKALRFIADQTH